ncbi:SpoIIE family protein phosphatase [Fimbriiglobus ruber]|uniref:Serine phosphatase RsbU, regulator of sigma subunit n=1 Tax=Fimbriiglobus ruber TaxID=1908690 RepID=A0A225DV05_9BACT|nr:SpoIIE family protein phosphatase [Fimbriiglobus ruber]OWK42358.1 Serine phosphatase RsbU, regulator of sigma subunit [Fimbriiglobus ruber]
MPSLILLKSPGGATAGVTYTLAGDLFVIGRDADTCQIVIPNGSVSRKHAQIRRAQGQFLIEDLESRNGTVVNNQKVSAPTPLKNDDRVKICDFLFRFHDDRPTLLRPAASAESDDVFEVEEGNNTTVRHSVPRAAAQQIIDTQPAERLRALLDISTSLSRTLELEPLLPQIADALFNVFRQADRCFVIMLDAAGRMVPKVVKSRRPGADDDHRFSRTIVKRCLDTSQSYLTEDAAADTDIGPSQSIAEFRIRSVMCVPLIAADGTRLGAMVLDTQSIAAKFREDDLKLLTIVANLASVAIEKAQALTALVSREKERKEIEIARKVQVGFLPKAYPGLQGYEFYAHYSPAQSVGGDYYDFIALPRGRVAVVLGDVAGKGVAAALLMAKLSAEVRFCMLTEPDPASAIRLLNEQLIQGGIGDRFVTLAAFIIDPASHQVTVVNAGHVNPLRYRTAAGDLTEVVTNAESGVPLGAVSGWEYVAKIVPLEVGDTLLVFTDGVTDSENAEGVPFRPDGVRRAVQTDSVIGADGRPHGVGDRLVRAVTKHAGGHPQFDDIALVCFGRVEGGPITTTGSHLVPRLVE